MEHELDCPCPCGAGYPRGLCPDCDRPHPHSVEGVGSLACSLARHRRRLQRRAGDPAPLLELLMESAAEHAFRGQDARAGLEIEEGLARVRRFGPPPAPFLLGLARLCHLCGGWEEVGIRWLDEGLARYEEWHLGGDSPDRQRLVAYRALLEARSGRCRTALETLQSHSWKGAPPDAHLRLAEVLLWCGHPRVAREILERLLRRRGLGEEDRHIAYVLMIDALHELGRDGERRVWERRERDWCRRHGRTPCGAPAGSAAQAAVRFLMDHLREASRPLDRDLLRKLQRLREAMDAPPEAPEAWRLRVCRFHPLLAVEEIRKLSALDARGRRETFEFARLFHGHLPVGGLLLALGKLPEVEEQLVAWLDDFHLGAYAQRALEGCGTRRRLLQRALERPGSAGSLRATAALGRLSGRGAGEALLRLLRHHRLCGTAALALADRGDGGALPALTRALTRAPADQRPWVAVALWSLECRRRPGHWWSDFRPDPGRGRFRLLSHPVEEILRGYLPLELHGVAPGEPRGPEDWKRHLRQRSDLCRRCRRQGRVPGGVRCLCQRPAVRRWVAVELERWRAAGARNTHEVFDVVEEAMRRKRRLCVPRKSPGGGDGLATLACALRWLLEEGVENLVEAAHRLRNPLAVVGKPRF